MKFIFLSLISLFLFGCAESQNPPLSGKRLNVLHYDLLESDTPTKAQIDIPIQRNLSSWNISDIGQFTGLPSNFSLSDKIKNSSSFKPDKFNPTTTQNSAVMIIGDVFYSYSSGALAAYNISTKKNLWSVNPVAKNERGDVLGGGIAYYNNVVYLSSGARDFIAFNAENGNELWRSKLPNVVRNIALIFNNQIYVTSIDNKVSCFSLEGNLLWRHNAAIYSLISSRIYIPSIVYEEKLITTTTAGDLIVLNRHDGEELTEVNLATEAIIGDGSLAKGPISSPVLDGYYLYVLTGENEIIKIDLKNPRILWRQNFSAAKAFWVAGNITYMLTENNQLLAMENEQGKLVWITDLAQYFKQNKLLSFYGPLMAGNNLVITANNGEFLLLSPNDGKLISRHKNDFSINRMPICLDKKLYFISNSGKISIWE